MPENRKQDSRIAREENCRDMVDQHGYYSDELQCTAAQDPVLFCFLNDFMFHVKKFIIIIMCSQSKEKAEKRETGSHPPSLSINVFMAPVLANEV